MDHKEIHENNVNRIKQTVNLHVISVLYDEHLGSATGNIFTK
jgi:hypothetical protein